MNTGLEAPLGPVTIVLQAKGKFPSGEETITIPALTLNVVRPADVVLSAPAFEVKPGTTAEVKGKVNRKGTFKEPVTVRINGLPAGLKAEPLVVPPGSADFSIKVVADSKAAPATATAQLVSAFQVNKKDYPTTALPLAVKVLPGRCSIGPGMTLMVSRKIMFNRRIRAGTVFLLLVLARSVAVGANLPRRPRERQGTLALEDRRGLEQGGEGETSQLHA